MEQLTLLATLWKEGDDTGQDATVTVEDGVVVYLRFEDGYEVRLLLHELERLFDFAIEQAIKQEEEAGEPITHFKTEDEVPF